MNKLMRCSNTLSVSLSIYIYICQAVQICINVQMNIITHDGRSLLCKSHTYVDALPACVTVMFGCA